MFWLPNFARHPEQSEGSRTQRREIPRFARNDDSCRFECDTPRQQTRKVGDAHFSIVVRGGRTVANIAQLTDSRKSFDTPRSPVYDGRKKNLADEKG
jgi:hypothetical protein